MNLVEQILIAAAFERVDCRRELTWDQWRALVQFFRMLAIAWKQSIIVCHQRFR